MAAGWNLDLKNDPIATSSYRKHCGTHTFWGYKYGKKVLHLKTLPKLLFNSMLVVSL